MGGRVPMFLWKNARGLEKPLRGSVFILHGLGEHASRYEDVARFLTQLDFDVISQDHAGHGLALTDGGMKELPSMEEALTEVEDTWTHLKRGGPWFLLGHSFGALLGLKWILRGKKSLSLPYEFATRAFISAPPLELRMPVPEWKRKLAINLRSLMPTLRIENEISPDYLSHDILNVEHYRTDPLVHGHASPKLFVSLLETVQNVIEHPMDIEIPVALAVGEEDPIVQPVAIENYYERLNTHKTLYRYPNRRHEILNEIGRERVYQHLAEWFL